MEIEKSNGVLTDFVSINQIEILLHKQLTVSGNRGAPGMVVVGRVVLVSNIVWDFSTDTPM